MGNFKALDKDSNPIEFAAEGTGASSAPFVPHHKVVASVLPEDAATASKQEIILQKLEQLLQKLTATINGLKIDGSAVTQPVSGAISINNFPASTAVAGIVSVDNFPGLQTIAGAVAINNFPATQAISGTVGINNFPATQAVSIAAMPLPSGAATDITLGQVRDRLPQQRLSYQNLGTSSAGVVKNSAGVVSAIAVYNKSSAIRWIQLYNKSAAPSGSDAPVENHPIFASSYLVLDSAYFGQLGLAFSNGVSFGFSSTSGTFTSATATDLELHVKYL